MCELIKDSRVIIVPPGCGHNMVYCHGTTVWASVLIVQSVWHAGDTELSTKTQQVHNHYRFDSPDCHLHRVDQGLGSCGAYTTNSYLIEFV